LGEIADAAKQSFLTDLAWGGLKAGTKFNEPAPLFPRAEKDAVERMQNLEDENNRSAVEAASAETAKKNQSAAPARHRAPSVSSVMSTDADESKANENLTQATNVSHDPRSRRKPPMCTRFRPISPAAAEFDAFRRSSGLSPHPKHRVGHTAGV